MVKKNAISLGSNISVLPVNLYPLIYTPRCACMQIAIFAYVCISILFAHTEIVVQELQILPVPSQHANIPIHSHLTSAHTQYTYTTVHSTHVPLVLGLKNKLVMGTLTKTNTTKFYPDLPPWPIPQWIHYCINVFDIPWALKRLIVNN